MERLADSHRLHIHNKAFGKTSEVPVCVFRMVACPPTILRLLLDKTAWKTDARYSQRLSSGTDLDRSVQDLPRVDELPDSVGYPRSVVVAYGNHRPTRR